MAGRGGALLARFVDGFLAWSAGDPARAAPLGPLLGDAVAAQERGDAIGLADLLEHELAPALEEGVGSG